LTEQERRAKRETYMSYTSDEEQRLIQMREAGKSQAEIKEAFPDRTKKGFTILLGGKQKQIENNTCSSLIHPRKGIAQNRRDH
jgi:hypothetical protein